MIPYGRQDISKRDIESVVEILCSDYITQGPAVPRFEAEIANKVGAKYAVAVSNGTAALHVACMALGLGKGDTLWTTPITFVASANCALYCGAEVDFVDIDPHTWNISLEGLKAKLENAEQNGTLPKVLVPVHFSGLPTEQEAIWELAEHYGFSVIEDASHSIGAKRNTEPVGSCRWSHITTFSFHPVKLITTGEGGMAVTNDEGLYRKLVSSRAHGITRDAEQLIFKKNIPGQDTKSNIPPWYYEQQSLGFNYRMTDIQAALGISQLSRLDSFIEQRKKLASHYGKELFGQPVRLQSIGKETESAHHLYVIRIKSEVINRSHYDIFMEMRNNGVGVNLHYIPVYLHPFYKQKGFRPGYCRESEKYYGEAMSLPLYPTMQESQLHYVIDTLKKALMQ